jgi:hypothetical protein
LFRKILINLNIHELKVFHHVSIFSNEYRLGHQVFCLGGNQNDKVTLKAYPSEQVLGYRRLNTIEH